MHGAKADDTSHFLDYEGTLVESFFSPTDLVAFEVWDALGDAGENTLLVHDLARAYHAEWQRLWSALGIGQKPGF